jgi:hypothetical protein
MASVFRRQLKATGSIDFSRLLSFEIHRKYRFDRFMGLSPKITVDKKTSVLNVNLTYGQHPTFKKSRYIDGYQLTLIGVFPDLENRTASTVAVQTPIMGLGGQAPPLSMELAIPPGAETFLVCLKIEGCMKGKVNRTAATKGMRMMVAGVV